MRERGRGGQPSHTSGGRAGIEFKLNTTVTAADVAAKTLTTAAGDTIRYEKLIIATGSGVRASFTAASRAYTGIFAAAQVTRYRIFLVSGQGRTARPGCPRTAPAAQSLPQT